MLLIPIPVAQAILNYLATQPYQQVHELIHALQALEPAPEPTAPSPDAPTP